MRLLGQDAPATMLSRIEKIVLGCVHEELTRAQSRLLRIEANISLNPQQFFAVTDDVVM